MGGCTVTEIEQLAQLCERLGAPPGQAATMATQLTKRATQLAAERGITREAALGRLLELVVKGRAGEVPADFAPPKSHHKTSG
jgi:hypothetical protein